MNNWNWENNSFSGKIPKMDIRFTLSGKEADQAIRSMFAQVMLKQRLDEAPKQLFQYVMLAVLSMVLVSVSSYGIAESKSMSVNIWCYIVGVLMFCGSMVLVQEPYEICINKSKYEKYLN